MLCLCHNILIVVFYLKFFSFNIYNECRHISSLVFAKMSTTSRTLSIIIKPFSHMIYMTSMCTTLTPYIDTTYYLHDKYYKNDYNKNWHNNSVILKLSNAIIISILIIMNYHIIVINLLLIK